MTSLPQLARTALARHTAPIGMPDGKYLQPQAPQGEGDRMTPREKIRAQPPCFTDEQWQSWSDHRHLARPSKYDTYCEDCTPAYKTEMQQQGRCWWPCVKFVKRDGFVVGVRQSLRKEAA